MCVNTRVCACPLLVLARCVHLFPVCDIADTEHNAKHHACDHVCMYIRVCVLLNIPCTCMVQWNLSIEDTTGPSWLSCIQWNLSIEDTIGTQLAVLYREVFLIQR